MGRCGLLPLRNIFIFSGRRSYVRCRDSHLLFRHRHYRDLSDAACNRIQTGIPIRRGLHVAGCGWPGRRFFVRSAKPFVVGRPAPNEAGFDRLHGRWRCADRRRSSLWNIAWEDFSGRGFPSHSIECVFHWSFGRDAGARNWKSALDRASSHAAVFRKDQLWTLSDSHACI